MKNLFITGKPGSGKTTLVMKVVSKLNKKVYGFYTKEIREKGERVGFEIINFENKKGILAHKDIKSKYRVSKYGVNIDDLEKVGVDSINEGIKSGGIIVIDEVGKMELFSNKFIDALFSAINSKSKVFGTIMEKSHIIADKIKERNDTKILRIEETNISDIISFLNENSIP